MTDQRAFVGEVDPRGGCRLWYYDGTGVRRPLERSGGDGLSWGYAGPGPRTAARTLLVAASGDPGTAQRLEEAFVRDVVAKLPLNERFALPVANVEAWMAANGVAQAPARRRAGAEEASDPTPPPAAEADHRGPELAARARALDVREHQLALREQRVDAMAAGLGVVPTVVPADSLPAEPFRRQLEALMIDSGDDVADVARAHGIDPAWASAVATGAVVQLDVAGVRRACEALRCTPYDLWGVAGARSIARAYGPADWPANTEPLLPVDGAEAAPLDAGGDWPSLAAAPAPEPAGPAPDFGPELVA